MRPPAAAARDRPDTTLQQPFGDERATDEGQRGRRGSISISSRRACSPSRTTVATVTAALLGSARARPAPRSQGASNATQPLAVVADVGDAGSRPQPLRRQWHGRRPRPRAAADFDRSGKRVVVEVRGQRRQVRELAAEACQRLRFRHVFASGADSARSMIASMAPRSSDVASSRR